MIDSLLTPESVLFVIQDLKLKLANHTAAVAPIDLRGVTSIKPLFLFFDRLRKASSIFLVRRKEYFTV